MIAFGSAIVEPKDYERWAEPGIRLAAEPDSRVLAYRAQSSVFRSYNLILDQAAALDDLEALVLVHQDTEIVDAEFCEKVRRALEDEEVGVIGCIGAIGVRSIAWWEGSVTWASFIHRYEEFGGGDLPGFAWREEETPPFARTGDVDVVDGFLMVLSPWVVRNIRFDESLGALHGYDVDFCLQVGAAGRKVVTQELRAVHNHSLELVRDPDGWVDAHMRVAEKWDGRIPGMGGGSGDWRQRARRAEAESELVRAKYRSQELRYEARERELAGSISWRITAPLRRVNQWRRSAPKSSRERPR
jgi:hypothetical protein